MKGLLQDGIVTKIEDGYIISSEMFWVPNTDSKIETYKKVLDERAQQTPSYMYDRVYRAFYEHYNTGFKNLKMPKSRFPMALETGLFFSRKKEENTPKPMKNYPF